MVCAAWLGPGAERRQIEDNLGDVASRAERLSSDNQGLATGLAALPDMLKGFGHVKARNVALYAKGGNDLLNRFEEAWPVQAATDTRRRQRQRRCCWLSSRPAGYGRPAR